MDMKKMDIETRIASLKTKPVQNEKLIKKWERKLRQWEKEHA